MRLVTEAVHNSNEALSTSVPICELELLGLLVEALKTPQAVLPMSAHYGTMNGMQGQLRLWETGHRGRG